MKRITTLTTWLLYLSCFYIQPAVGQDGIEQPEDPIVGKLHLQAKPYQDKVVLRWAIDNPAAWLALRDVGVRIDRVILDEDNNPMSTDWELITVEPIMPWTTEYFQSSGKLDPDNDHLLIVAEALYGDPSVRNVSSEDMESIDDASMEFHNKFLFALMAADMNGVAAEALGLRYEDQFQVDARYKYAYRVYPAEPLISLFRIDTAMFMTQGLLKDQTSAPRGLHTLSQDQAIRIEIPFDPLHNNYTAYHIERSEDGKNFSRINHRPVVFNHADSLADYFFTDSVANYKTYYYRVNGLDAFGDISDYSPVLSGMATNQTAPPRGQLYAQVVPGGEEVVLTWQQDRHENRPLAGFIVRRGHNIDQLDDYLTPKMLPETQLEFRDRPTALTAGVYYQVLSVDTSGNYSGTNVQHVFAYDSIPPAAPTGLKAAVDTNGVVQLSWQMDMADQIQGYRVFISNNPDMEFSPISSDLVRDTLFVDTLDRSLLNREVFYRLVSVDGNHNHSGFSDILTVKRPKRDNTPAPVIGEYLVKAGGVTFSWSLPPGDDHRSVSILRRLSGDTVWNNIAELALTVRGYTDETVDENNDYEYAVVVVDEQGRWSDISYPLSVFIYAATKPSPVDFRLEASQGKHRLTWGKPSGGTISHYVIYKDMGQGLEQFEAVGADVHVFEDSGTTTTNYGLRAFFADGTKSDLVSLASAHQRSGNSFP